jgi:hypothetical protein
MLCGGVRARGCFISFAAFDADAVRPLRRIAHHSLLHYGLRLLRHFGGLLTIHSYTTALGCFISFTISADYSPFTHSYTTRLLHPRRLSSWRLPCQTLGAGRGATRGACHSLRFSLHRWLCVALAEATPQAMATNSSQEQRHPGCCSRCVCSHQGGDDHSYCRLSS